MSNWTKCDHHGTENQAVAAGMVNDPVNLDFVVSFSKGDGAILHFLIPPKTNIAWEFINADTRDLEYKRLLTLV